MTTKLIEAVGLVKAFGGVPAVDGLDVAVHAGEIYALAGPDGAGKTTAIRLLCGALQADAGEITLAGFDLRTQIEQARAQIGYLPQRFSLYGELTVEENLRFLAEVRGLPPEQWRERSQQILSFVRLEEFVDRKAEALSGGMRQKLGLAAAMVHRPKILLLDEPTGGVDPVTRQQFWQLLIRLLGQGVAVLMSTPYMDEAARCNRIGFLNRGRLVTEGPPQSITSRLSGRVADLRGGPRPLLEAVLRADPEVMGVQGFGDRLHLRLVPEASSGALPRLQQTMLAAGGHVEWLRPAAPTLEDAFVELLEEGA